MSYIDMNQPWIYMYSRKLYSQPGQSASYFPPRVYTSEPQGYKALVGQIFIFLWAEVKWLSGKESTCKCRRWRRGFNPRVRKILWRSAWQPTPVFLPGESHGQGSLEGCSPWGPKELDTTEQLSVSKRMKSSFKPQIDTPVCFILRNPLGWGYSDRTLWSICQIEISLEVLEFSEHWGCEHKGNLH